MLADPAAAIFSPAPTTAMADMTPLSLADISKEGADLEVSLESAFQVGSKGTVLAAPRFKGKPILLNLTAGTADWVKVLPGFDYLDTVLPHHQESGATAVKILLQLPEDWVEPLCSLDREISKQSLSYEDTADYNWMSILKPPDGICASLVVDGSEAPTIIRFISSEGLVTKGSGFEFLQSQLGDSKLLDYECKVQVELQFVEVNVAKHRKSTGVKVHSIVFARRPKTEVVDYSDEQIAAFVRARAKRLRTSV